MTPAELRDELRALCKSIGPDATASVVVSGYGRTTPGADAIKPIMLFIRPKGFGDKLSLTVAADDWVDAIRAALVTVATYRTEAVDAMVRNMSLTILSASFERGLCTPADLLAAGFTMDQLAEHGSAACERANAMSGRGPFQIGEAVAS